MPGKFLRKFGLAFILLSVILIFLGINFVPRIKASTSNEVNNVVAVQQTIPLLTNNLAKLEAPVITTQLSLAKSDWIERHPSSYYVNSDWVERHATNYYRNSDWVERHPPQPNQ